MTNGNENYFPWEETKEDNVLPTMIGHFRIKTLEDGQSQNTGKRMPRAIFECVAPLEYAGQAHFENYVVGSDEAPGAFVPGSMGTRNFKKMAKAAQIPPNNDVAVLMASAEGSELLLSIVEYKETQEGQWKGQPRNRIAGYFKLGEREIGIAPVQGAGKPGVVAPPAAPVMPPPAVAPPVAPAIPPPAAVAPVAVAPAVPTAPATPATPAAPVMPPPPQAPAAPAAAGQGTLLCSICQTQVLMAEFGAHVQRHQTEPGWDGRSA